MSLKDNSKTFLEELTERNGKEKALGVQKVMLEKTGVNIDKVLNEEEELKIREYLNEVWAESVIEGVLTGELFNIRLV